MKRISYIFIFLVILALSDWGVSMFLNQGLNRYFGFDKPADMLLVGHSHLMLALDKEKLEQELDITVAKYCREGVNVSDRKQMVEHFLSLPAASHLKTVVYGVDPFMFTGKGLSANSYKLFYPFMDSPVMDNYIRHQAGDEMDYWQHKLFRTTRYSDALVNSAIRGWLNNWSNFKNGQVSQEIIDAAARREIAFEPDLIRDFSETIHTLSSAGIKVILLNTPVVNSIREQNVQKWMQIDQILNQIAKQSDLVEYRDYNPHFSASYHLFYDAIHLNQQGQTEVTKFFIDEQKGMLP